MTNLLFLMNSTPHEGKQAESSNIIGSTINHFIKPDLFYKGLFKGFRRVSSLCFTKTNIA